MKQKILHCAGSMGRCDGRSSVIMNICHAYHDHHNIQFDFVCRGYETGDYYPELVSDGSCFYHVFSRKNGWWLARQTWKKFFQLCGNRYDVFHYHTNNFKELSPIIYAKKYGVKKVVVHAHNTTCQEWYSRWLHRLNKEWAAKYIDQYLACSEDSAKWVFPAKISREKRYQVLANGVDTLLFRYDEAKRDDARKKLGLEKKAFALCHVGRFSTVKNHAFIIKVFTELLSINSNAKLLLVGEGELFQQIKNEAEGLSDSGAIQWLGNRSDVNEILQAADAFILPSLQEGFPMAAVEAQTAGLPCYFSDVIDRKVQLTPLCRFIPLETPPEEWARRIVRDSADFVRTDRSREIEEKHFDLSGIRKVMDSIYF